MWQLEATVAEDYSDSSPLGLAEETRLPSFPTLDKVPGSPGQLGGLKREINIRFPMNQTTKGSSN